MSRPHLPDSVLQIQRRRRPAGDRLGPALRGLGWSILGVLVVLAVVGFFS